MVADGEARSVSVPEFIQKRDQIRHPRGGTKQPEEVPEVLEVAGSALTEDSAEASIGWREKSEAERQWDLLDVTATDSLNRDESLQLAAWLWSSFRPGQEPTEAQIKEEASKMVKRCGQGISGLEANQDGTIQKQEFLAYYEVIADAQKVFGRARAESSARAKQPQEIAGAGSDCVGAELASFQHDLNDRVDEIDRVTDGDGNLDQAWRRPTEMAPPGTEITEMLGLSEAQRSEAVRVFQVVASIINKDGLVTKDELAAAMGGDIHIFDDMDLDQDGLVSLENFAAFVAKVHTEKGGKGDTWLKNLLYTLRSASY